MDDISLDLTMAISLERLRILCLIMGVVFTLGKVEPLVREHSLKFERKYYKVTEGRAVITEDKKTHWNGFEMALFLMIYEV